MDWYKSSMIGVICRSFFGDSYGIELIHPRRQGRSKKQIGKKRKSNQRWIVGSKRGWSIRVCFLLNHLGLIINWDCATADVYDGSAFQDLVEAVKEQIVVFSNTGFEKSDWYPENLRPCKRGEWSVRMVAERTSALRPYYRC